MKDNKMLNIDWGKIKRDAMHDIDNIVDKVEPLNEQQMYHVGMIGDHDYSEERELIKLYKELDCLSDEDKLKLQGFQQYYYNKLKALE